MLETLPSLVASPMSPTALFPAASPAAAEPITSHRDAMDNAQREILDVAIVDDDSAMRDSLGCIMRASGYRTALFGSAEEFWKEFEASQPHCVLIDMVMPGVTGLMLCRRLAAAPRLTTSFALISGQAEVAAAVEAMKLGAIDLLEKPFSRQQVMEVVAKGVSKSKATRERLAQKEEVMRRIAKLTPREQEILEAMSHGRITKEIAKRYGISTRTVDVHRSRIMEKLELISPTQLAYVISLIDAGQEDRASKSWT